MPTITIQCDHCGNEEETTGFDIYDWVERCPHCTNDACPNCRDKEHVEYHPDCWKDSQVTSDG